MEKEKDVTERGLNIQSEKECKQKRGGGESESEREIKRKIRKINHKQE